MNSILIAKLKPLIEEGWSKDRMEEYEDVVADEIEKFVKEKESFFELPTNKRL